MLPIPLSDTAISQLIGAAKSIPEGLSLPLRPMIERNGHWQKGFEIDGDPGNRFVVKIRQSCVNTMNFSVILGYMLPGSYTVFRLRRYNGKSHYHTNVLENERFYDFHVHVATERYQRPGYNEEHFAERTDRYWNLESAIRCLLDECGFGSPLSGTSLFRNI